MSFEDKRQLLIVRQSQLERAMEYYRTIGVEPSLTELVRTAELLKDFVYNGIDTNTQTRVTAFDEYVKTKKKNK